MKMPCFGFRRIKRHNRGMGLALAVLLVVVSGIDGDLAEHFGSPRVHTTLQAVQTEGFSGVWIIPRGNVGQAKQITFGKLDGLPGIAWTPDGRIVYATRDFDLWIVDKDGGNRRFLTGDKRLNVRPSVSSDSRYIVFASMRKGLHIWRMDIDGRNLKQLTRVEGGDFPLCSPDQRWVIFQAKASGKWALWKIPIDGGEPALLTERLSSAPAVSPDGSLIAGFNRPFPASPDTISIFAFGSRRAVKNLVAFPATVVPAQKIVRWTPDGHALTYIVNNNGVCNIWSQSLEGGPPKQLTDFKAGMIWSFDWSKDNDLALARGVFNNNFFLISNTG